MAQTDTASRVEIPVEIPQKPKWECNMQTQPKDSKGFTVGEIFQINCAGESLELVEPLKIVNAEAIKYSVVYLKTLKKSENELQFLATSYASKPVSHPFLHVSDAKDSGFISQAMEIRTQSVVDPQNPPQSPFGPIQPMAMNWPYWIFFAGLLFAAVLIGWAAVFIRRTVQRRNLERNIRKFQSPIGSYHQFSKDLRLLKRGVLFSQNANWDDTQTKQYLEKLNEVFRMYVLREYTVPALTWSIARIAQHIRKKNKNGYGHFKNAILKAFKELERAQSNIKDLKPQDCEQLTQLCWLAADLMWKHKLTARRSTRSDSQSNSQAQSQTTPPEKSQAASKPTSQTPAPS